MLLPMRTVFARWRAGCLAARTDGQGSAAGHTVTDELDDARLLVGTRPAADNGRALH